MEAQDILMRFDLRCCWAAADASVSRAALDLTLHQRSYDTLPASRVVMAIRGTQHAIKRGGFRRLKISREGNHRRLRHKGGRLAIYGDT